MEQLSMRQTTGMEWLSLLASHPAALSSFLTWLKAQEHLCHEFALDIPEQDRQALRGKRDSFRDMQAYVQNNMKMIERSVLAAPKDAPSYSNIRN